jgi:hypothetical protein
MRGILFLTILAVRSSYIREIEEPLEASNDVPDTIQWWIAQSGNWRIRTYAMDHDIHTHSIGEISLDFAMANTLKHYGDIIQAQYEVALDDCADQSSIEEAFRAANLNPRFDVSPNRFIFWKPDDARYHSQSTPR